MTNSGSETRTLPEARRAHILKLLESGSLRITEVARILQISIVTARRDLDTLGRLGLVHRTHGGALPLRMGTAQEPPFAVKSRQMRSEKERIAMKAAEMVSEGATIILDSGTTMLAFARSLRNRHFTAVALDLCVAQSLAERPAVEVLLPGGQIRNGLFSMIGPWTEQALDGIYADLFFMAADAIDLSGVTNSTVEEAAIKRLAMKRSEEHT